jgi:hypothetical protein
LTIEVTHASQRRVSAQVSWQAGKLAKKLAGKAQAMAGIAAHNLE